MRDRSLLVICAVVASLAASCGSSADTTQSTSLATTTVAPANTTAAVTTTEAPSTTTTVNTTTLPPSTTVEVPALQLIITWDGQACGYQGPDSAPLGITAEVVFRNTDEVPADIEIGYLSSEASVEAAVAKWPTEYRSGTEIPSEVNHVVGIPEYPNSVDPGGEVVATVQLVIPRVHVFSCWIGGANAVPQGTAMAASGLTITEG